MQYCLVQNDTIGRPQALPRNWQNISNFHLLDPDIIATYGWYPCHTSEQPAYDPSTHKITETLTLGDAEVVQSWTVEALTPEEQMQYLRSIRPQFDQLIEQHMRTEVSYRDYQSVDTALARWRGSKNTQWQSEALEVQAFIDKTYETAYAIENAVVAGNRPVPTEAEFLAELPTLGWGPPAPPDNGNLPSNGTI